MTWLDINLESRYVEPLHSSSCILSRIAHRYEKRKKNTGDITYIKSLSIFIRKTGNWHKCIGNFVRDYTTKCSQGNIFMLCDGSYHSGHWAHLISVLGDKHLCMTDSICLVLQVLKTKRPFLFSLSTTFSTQLHIHTHG